MKFFILAALPALVAAQYGAPAGPPASSSSSASSSAPAASASPLPGQHFIDVGMNNTVTFSPQTITAAANDTVTFRFSEFNGMVMHSVTQSTFSQPCELAPGGFASGLQTSGSVFTITVLNASAPIWFFCSQTSPLKHCNLEMVGAINPPTSGPNVMSNFILAASTASDPVQTASGVLTGLGAVATAPAGIPSSSAAAATTSATSSAGKLIAGAGSLLAGLFTVAYTIA